jgi:hypothetical protein
LRDETTAQSKSEREESIKKFFIASTLAGWLDEEEVGTKSEKKLKTNRERSLIV